MSRHWQDPPPPPAVPLAFPIQRHRIQLSPDWPPSRRTDPPACRASESAARQADATRNHQARRTPAAAARRLLAPDHDVTRRPVTGAGFPSDIPLKSKTDPPAWPSTPENRKASCRGSESSRALNVCRGRPEFSGITHDVVRRPCRASATNNRCSSSGSIVLPFLRDFSKFWQDMA